MARLKSLRPMGPRNTRAIPTPSKVQMVAEGKLTMANIATMASTCGNIASPARVKVEMAPLTMIQAFGLTH